MLEGIVIISLLAVVCKILYTKINLAKQLSAKTSKRNIHETSHAPRKNIYQKQAFKNFFGVQNIHANEEDMETQILGSWKFTHSSGKKGFVEKIIPINRDGQDFYIGRSSDDDYIITEDETISSNHLRIFMRAGKLFLSDNESTNGVYVRSASDDELIKIEEIEMIGKTEIYIGKTQLVFQRYNPFSKKPKSARVKKEDNNSTATLTRS